MLREVLVPEAAVDVLIENLLSAAGFYLFCNLEIFDKIQTDLSNIFNTINGVATKLKETLDLYNTPSKN